MISEEIKFQIVADIFHSKLSVFKIDVLKCLPIISLNYVGKLCPLTSFKPFMNSSTISCHSSLQEVLKFLLKKQPFQVFNKILPIFSKVSINLGKTFHNLDLLDASSTTTVKSRKKRREFLSNNRV